VLADQRDVFRISPSHGRAPFDQPTEQTPLRVNPGSDRDLALYRVRQSPSGNSGGQFEHGGIVGVQHPRRVFTRRVEQPCLVRVVAVDIPVSIQVIGREIQQHPDLRFERIEVGELE
jgi:hypothetical protein